MESEEQVEKEDTLTEPINIDSKDFENLSHGYMDAVVSKGNDLFNSGLCKGKTAVLVAVWAEDEGTEALLRFTTNVSMEFASYIVEGLKVNLENEIQAAKEVS